MGTPDPNDARRHLDTQSLSGLAHPLRVELFQQLSHYGPATATQLAERLGESSGSTSYHLRQLERFGFVETDPERGNGRERWWRRVPGGVLINTPDREGDPAGHAAAKLVIGELQLGRRKRLEQWLTGADDWPKEWYEGSNNSSTNLTLTAGEMAELSKELDDVMVRWKQRSDARRAPDDAKFVELQIALFPLSAAG